MHWQRMNEAPDNKMSLLAENRTTVCGECWQTLVFQLCSPPVVPSILLQVDEFVAKTVVCPVPLLQGVTNDLFLIGGNPDPLSYDIK